MAERAEKYEVIEDLGQIGKKNRKGYIWSMRLRRVSWYGSDPMWDIREWDADGKPGKGITLTESMMENLKAMIMQPETGYNSAMKTR